MTPPNKDGRCGKSWRYAYRLDGTQKCMTIGPYPVFSLKEAREAMAVAKKQVIQGIDPSALKKSASNSNGSRKRRLYIYR